MEDADHHEHVDRLEHATRVVCLTYRYKRQNLKRTAAAAGRAGGELDPAKRTPQEWAQLSDVLARPRPLAGEAVRAAFQQTMTAAIERQLQKTLKG